MHTQKNEIDLLTDDINDIWSIASLHKLIILISKIDD